MGLIPKFTRSDVRKAFAARTKAIERAVITNLLYLAEQLVNQARSTNSYQDQTGNLRNSIGYVLLRNGKVIRSDFKRSASVVAVVNGKKRTTKGSKDGVQAGRDKALEVAKEYTTGYALIVVAGMNYAALVESRGLDVLTSAEQLARTELPRMLRDLKVDIASIR